MATNITPPKVTGGGGFGFEDKVAAYFLSCVLVDEPPLSSDFGTIHRMDFQTRADGWHLDDILLTLRSGASVRRVAISVKSNQQFSKDSAPSDFVTACWEIFLDAGLTQFDRTKDLLALATSPTDRSFKAQLDELLSWARVQTAADLSRRVATQNYGSDVKRGLLRSFTCPEVLAKKHGQTNEQSGELLAVIHHFEFDFDTVPSASEAAAISRCRTALDSGDLGEAGLLWDALCGIARSLRPNSGFINLARLLDRLREKFRLKLYPQFTADWQHLDRYSRDNLAAVSDTIGGKVRLPRQKEIQALKSVTTAAAMAVLGPSGCGKTVLVKLFAEDVLTEVPILWFNAATFEKTSFGDIERALGLSHPLGALVDGCTRPTAFAVIDGIDRIFHRQAFANVAALIKMLTPVDRASPWHIIVSCQPEEWSRVQLSLSEVDLRLDWNVFDVSAPTDLAAVWTTFPKLEILALRQELQSLLFRPDILNLLATRVATVDADKWVGESDIIEWLWQSVISTGRGGSMRSGFVSSLAEKQGDESQSEISLDEFNVADRAPLDDLVTERICTTRENRVDFYHDRLGDWGRQRVLLGHIHTLPTFLETRSSSPSWHMAIRLLGVHLLEQYQSSEEWQKCFIALGKGENPTIEQDLVLDALVVAANPVPLLNRVWDLLCTANGKLLNRLLRRFRHFATFPNPLAIATARPGETVEAATILRLPYWPYWLPMIRFLHQHKEQVVNLAPKEVAQITDIWLRLGNQSWPMRREAAELALEVGRKILESSRHRYA